MAQQKPTIPKGTRDFGPLQMQRRTYMLDVIRGAFKRHGFLPIETPAMENLSTLLGKYGEEGDRLLFRILNSGDFTRDVDPELMNDPTALAGRISEKGLRYDLTVPFARFVVQHRNDIAFPFRRYQIQPVWRADRPQKGRYREFCQCDVDIIGSRSMLNEVELVQIVEDVFRNLGINVVLKINNRKILYGMAEVIGLPDRLTDITVAIDKIDKIGQDAVREEMIGRGLPPEAVDKLFPMIRTCGGFREKINALRTLLSGSETGLKGIEETETVFNYLDKVGMQMPVELDISLARGLNYYTGAIFEVKALDYEIGSICGGGRYDDLTGIFGMPDTSGVGISFGADRIYDVMLALGLFPEDAMVSTKVLFLNLGQEEEELSLRIVTNLRSRGIASEIYPEPAKLKKQMEYADRRCIPYVAIIGSEELRDGVVTLKNMRAGNQERIILDDLAEKIL